MTKNNGAVYGHLHLNGYFNLLGWRLAVGGWRLAVGGWRKIAQHFESFRIGKMALNRAN